MDIATNLVRFACVFGILQTLSHLGALPFSIYHWVVAFLLLILMTTSYFRGRRGL